MAQCNKFKFTKTALLDLKPMEGKDRYFVYDSSVRGFALMVTKTGNKSYYLIRSIDYRSVRIYIGPFPDLPPEKARKKAEELAAQIALGINPQDARQEKRVELTLGELMKEYLERHAKHHKKSWKYDEGQFERYMSKWSNRRLSTITRADIDGIHKKVGKENGKTAANRLLTLLKTVFKKGGEWDLFKGDNPGQYIKQFREKKRERHVTDAEMAVFMSHLEKHPCGDFRDYVQVSLYTGIRQGNIMAMKWDDVSLGSKTWKIPETKNGNSQVVELLPVVIELLERRQQQQAQETEWVFPDPRDLSKHLKRFGHTWDKFMVETKLKDLHMHDLRHTLATWMVNQGTDLAVVQKVLGHRKIETTMGYAHHAPDVKRGEMAKAVAAMNVAAIQEGKMENP